MKRILPILTLLSLFLPLAAYCAVDQRCFQDQYGDLYKFTGGKLGLKAYIVKVDNGCNAAVAGVATFSKLSDGTYLMSGFVGGDITGACVPFEIDASFNSDVTVGTGVYDNFPRGNTTDGPLNLTPISCALVAAPVSGGSNQTPTGNLPGKPTE